MASHYLQNWKCKKWSNVKNMFQAVWKNLNLSQWQLGQKSGRKIGFTSPSYKSERFTLNLTFGVFFNPFFNDTFRFCFSDMLPPVKTLYGKVCKKPRLQTILEENVEKSDVVRDSNSEKREELKRLLMEFRTKLTKRDILLAFELNRFMKTL